MGRRDKPKWQVNIAKERIKILFRQAAKVFSKRADLAHRYVFLARKIAMKFNLSIPKKFRRQFCHKCYHFLAPGKNARVRTNPKTKAVEWTCQDCGHVNRYGYSERKRSAR